MLERSIQILVLALSVIGFSSCNQLPLMFQTLEDIATDEAVEVVVYKNAMQKDTDIRATVEVINKDTVK